MCEAREDQRSKIHEIDSSYKADILPPLLFSSHTTTTHTHTHHYLLLRPVTVSDRCQDTKEERETTRQSLSNYERREREREREREQNVK